MMKKISKLALLAAATAFLLAAFPACSDDDNNNEPTPTVKPGDEEGSGGENGGSSTPATAKEYNFEGLAASDFLDASGTAVSAWGNNMSWGASATVNLPGGSTTVKEATVFCKVQTDASKQSLIRARTDADSKTTALNYNGGIATSIADGVSIDSLDRYVKIHVDGAGTVTASIKAVGSSGKTGNLQIALADKDGKLIGTVVTAAAGDGTITGTEANTGTVTGKVTAATDVYLVFSRNGAGGGGMDVYSIAVAPAAN